MAHVLTVIVFLPLAGALACLLIDKEEEGALRGLALGTSLLVFVASLLLLARFDASQGAFQFVEDIPWVPSLGIGYHVGVDGISLWLVLLTAFLTPLTLLSAWRAINKKVREFVICMLLLETAMLGAFVALDVFLFYVFWELMLVPMYMLIGIWGGERRLRASLKFVLYTMLGSLLMLVAIFYLYTQHHTATGVWTMDYEALRRTVLPRAAQMWCFLAFALAFAIKVPMFPLHTWLPDAHTEAPTAGSVILAGVLLKLGPFGFLRFAVPFFPWAAWVLSPTLAALGVAGIVYGAVVAFSQTDAKKFIAYTSISHLGFVLLGVFAWNARSIQGGIFTMISHGLTTGALFLGFGMLYERRHTRRLDEFGGIWARMPTFGGLFLVATMGSLGLPALSGFVGEFMTLLGAFNANDPTVLPAGARALAIDSSSPLLPLAHAKLTTAIATTGVILSAVYMLYLFHRLMLGPIKNPKNERLSDASGREMVVLGPIIALTILFGLYPAPVLSRMDGSVKRYLAEFSEKVEASRPDLPAAIVIGGSASAPAAGAAAGEAQPSPSPNPSRLPPPSMLPPGHPFPAPSALPQGPTLLPQIANPPVRP